MENRGIKDIVFLEKLLKNTLCGFIPAVATYRSAFPIAMPIPFAPKSSKPNTLVPSVTTIK